MAAVFVFTLEFLRVILLACHPEALLWPKDLPRCLELSCSRTAFHHAPDVQVLTMQLECCADARTSLFRLHRG